MKPILMVIDMQNDFLLPDAPLYGGDAVRAILPFVKKKIDEHLAAGNTVIFTKDWHDPDDAEFEIFPPHCIAGTSGADLVDEIRCAAQNPQVIMIHKTRYSAFYGTDLEQILKELQTEAGEELSFEIAGICTNICVFFTVEELRNRDYTVCVYQEGTASFDKKAHENALNQMKSILGARIV